MSNRQQTAERLFATASDLSPDERRLFLEKECRGEPGLRQLVDQLFADHDRAGSFLASPLLAGLQQDSSTESAENHLPAGFSLGRYTIIETIGSGGMGVVYRARDEKLERVVAVKVLALGVLVNEEGRRRFRREALALAKLNHEHIAAVYDVGEHAGVDYIVMECVAGESLAAKLKSGPLSVRDATLFAQQIARALEDAHLHGVVHRDLKPANVIITPKGNAKVLDFGLAKLLPSSPSDATLSLPETQLFAGTPLYMSPEQAHGHSVDARTDLWSLGVLYYQSLAGCLPFQAESTIGVLRAVIDERPVPLRKRRPDLPPLADRIASRALEKDPASRYQSASEIVADTATLLVHIGGQTRTAATPARPIQRVAVALGLLLLIAAMGSGLWLYHRSSRQRWARNVAIPQINALFSEDRAVEAVLLLERAEEYLPSDPQIVQIASEHTLRSSIDSTPAGATVAIQDYSAPSAPWQALGVTPLHDIRIPRGYFRWKLTKAGAGEWIAAPPTEKVMSFPLGDSQKVPGMDLVPAGEWGNYIGFVGWLGPYKLPPYLIDRHEVTNREYQKFLDSGGYEHSQYWPARFTLQGRELSLHEAMAMFRDTTGRPGPSNWVAGHYPEGAGDLPVSGVSRFEASAYAAYVGKELPVVAQWYNAAPPDLAAHIVQVSNFSAKGPVAVGNSAGVGPFGTYDMAGNIAEWTANSVDNDLGVLLGGSWKSPSYVSFEPEALSPFDRSETNGFRCVRNLGPLPEAATAPIRHLSRDFSRFKPVPQSVFDAYKLLYAYPRMPLNSRVEGVVKETPDWREERVTFDTAYRGERMAAYLFLPRNVRPPYQTVIFFPSARVEFMGDNNNGRDLGDEQFFDYVVQSGRAVMYPIYQDTYERTEKFQLPEGGQGIELTTDRYKDVARSLDYLATRPDIDSSKLAYLGVSMGAAEGVIAATLLQDRLKTAIFLDGGYFLDKPTPGGDQADFAPRMKKPVLMVNGRYDFAFSLEKAQNPLFAQLGTPPADKSHVLLDTPHDVTDQRPQLVKAVLDWLDHYLGRVHA